VYAIDGLFREQKYEMLTYTGGVMVIVVYVIGNYIDNGKNDEDIRLVSNVLFLIFYCRSLTQVRLILLCVFGPLNIIFAVMVFYRMGFLELNFIGANITNLRKSLWSIYILIVRMYFRYLSHWSRVLYMAKVQFSNCCKYILQCLYCCQYVQPWPILRCLSL